MENGFLTEVNSNVGIIHKICRVYFDNIHDRQDAYQEILYQLWKSYPSYSGESKFSTWMYKVALNTAITYIKKAAKHSKNEMLQEDAGNIPANVEQAGEDEKMSILYTAINTLGEIDKAIALLYLDDNTYDEIAMVTGLTKTNVSVRLVRIKKSLKEKLKNII
jgi:RNA polymerase sigma-70 factor (ECF subfamily)